MKTTNTMTLFSTVTKAELKKQKAELNKQDTGGSV